MTAPFDLRFMIAVQPLLNSCNIDGLVPYCALAILPLDNDGVLPTDYIKRLKESEQLKCAELKKLSARLGDDVIHFVVGFMPEDYQQVAATDLVRRHRVREAVYSLLRSVELDYGADSVDSLISLHLDSEIPHVHIAMSRIAVAGPLQKRISTLPAALLPLN